MGWTTKLELANSNTYIMLKSLGMIGFLHSIIRVKYESKEGNTMADEKIVLGAETKYPLNGILTFPNETNGLFPTVVLVHGSGPSNMDEKIGNNYPFKDLAEGLSEKGIAVLRYDKRTLVYGKEMKNDTGLSVKEETIDDAILASDFLQKDSRIDSNKIFIVGHSLGGGC